jgi:hypothetical protein
MLSILELALTSGISFDYPSTWKVEHPSFHEIQISNPAEPYNDFLISLPIQNNAEPSINIVDLDNRVTYQSPENTLIEPFTEQFIAGSNAAMGKIKVPPGIVSNSIVINHNGQVYVSQYVNTPKKFDDYDSQQTMNHIITSLRFT